MHRPNYIPVVADDFKRAVESAAKGRKKRPEVKEALKDVDGLCASIKQRLKDGSWRKDIEYRKLTKVNNNKKVRHIDAPTFRTLVYEHLLKNKLEPIYLRRQTFTVFDYEIRKSEKSGDPNWIKMLIGMPEVTDDGELTGKTVAREVHGGMMGIVAWMVEAEKEYGKKNLLPLEDVRIVDECGYIFEGSTNQMQYI